MSARGEETVGLFRAGLLGLLFPGVSSRAGIIPGDVRVAAGLRQGIVLLTGAARQGDAALLSVSPKNTQGRRNVTMTVTGGSNGLVGGER